MLNLARQLTPCRGGFPDVRRPGREVPVDQAEQQILGRRHDVAEQPGAAGVSQLRDQPGRRRAPVSLEPPAHGPNSRLPHVSRKRVAAMACDMPACRDSLRRPFVASNYFDQPSQWEPMRFGRAPGLRAESTVRRPRLTGAPRRAGPSPESPWCTAALIRHPTRPFTPLPSPAPEVVSPGSPELPPQSIAEAVDAHKYSYPQRLDVACRTRKRSPDQSSCTLPPRTSPSGRSRNIWRRHAAILSLPLRPGQRQLGAGKPPFGPTHAARRNSGLEKRLAADRAFLRQSRTQSRPRSGPAPCRRARTAPERPSRPTGTQTHAGRPLRYQDLNP